MEALASGLPTVVTGNGGPKFLVREGVTGFVAHEPQIFVQRIDELLMNKEKRLAMSRAAREFAMGISWDSIFEKVYTAYGHALRDDLARRASIITTDASRTRR
jgi:glycosyltransferase involved in cell wall biosynthesis